MFPKPELFSKLVFPYINREEPEYTGSLVFFLFKLRIKIFWKL